MTIFRQDNLNQYFEVKRIDFNSLEFFEPQAAWGYLCYLAEQQSGIKKDSLRAVCASKSLTLQYREGAPAQVLKCREDTLEMSWMQYLIINGDMEKLAFLSANFFDNSLVLELQQIKQTCALLLNSNAEKVELLYSIIENAFLFEPKTQELLAKYLLRTFSDRDFEKIGVQSYERLLSQYWPDVNEINYPDFSNVFTLAISYSNYKLIEYFLKQPKFEIYFPKKSLFYRTLTVDYLSPIFRIHSAPILQLFLTFRLQETMQIIESRAATFFENYLLSEAIQTLPEILNTLALYGFDFEKKINFNDKKITLSEYIKTKHSDNTKLESIVLTIKEKNKLASGITLLEKTVNTKAAKI